jgi:replication-associated recombination protein RarA
MNFIKKYRPNNIDELVLDENIKKIIRTFINQDSIRILFNGNSGTGKSTLIKLIVKEYYKDIDNYTTNVMIINDFEEKKDEYYNEGVLNFCKNRSSFFNKKKMIIIDNFETLPIHYQLLFKYYMETFENIHFLLSSTDLYKLVDGVKSILFIIKLEYFDYSGKINEIIEKEDIKISGEAKEKMIQLSKNNFKGVLNNLEKYKLINDETKEINDIDYNIFDDYFNELMNNNLKGGINIILSLSDLGYSVQDILYFCKKYITISNLSDKYKYEISKYIAKYITNIYIINEHKIELIFFTNQVYLVLTNQ